MNIGEDKTYTFFTRRTVPRTGKLVAQAMSGRSVVRIPFAISNLTLLGQPMASRPNLARGTK
jgi:hypothetical protein